MPHPSQIVADATYRSYATNRIRSPQILPTEWKRVFGNAVNAMEQRFQQERRARA